MLAEISIALAVYAVVSFLYFCTQIGEKYRPDRWYDIAILLPVLIIVTVLAPGFELARRSKTYISRFTK